MRRVASLRLRLVGGAALWIVAALLAAGVVLAGIFADHAARQHEAGIASHLDQLAAVAEWGAAGPALRHDLADPRFQRPYSGLYWQVELDGRAVLRSRSLWDQSIAVPPDPLVDGEVHRHDLAGPENQRLILLERAVSLPGATGPLRLAVASDRAGLDQAVGRFTRALVLSLGVLAVGLMAAAAAQVWFGLRPLRRVQQGVAAVREGRARRLDGAFPAEVAPLADELDGLLAHVEAMVERGRNQAGDLAHGLKTPLAVLANEAERLTALGDPLGHTLGAQVEAMRGHVERHLARARITAIARRADLRCEVAEAARPLVRAMARLHPDCTVTVDLPPGLAVRAEQRDLGEMLGNLLDNACTWARGQVRLSARESGDAVEVLVDDDGPGLSADQRERVFRRGERLDERVAGHGLGLAITREMAELHGGAVLLYEAPQGGLRAVLRLCRDRGGTVNLP